ncbi:MAG: Sua5/YciO/YrdC/YwlC family protein, partial [Candidatus Thioglobus sp.]|nr:Sua5/YciO/YrdC/YwlC family protein [Candidatus Thioglobus sp.]
LVTTSANLSGRQTAQSSLKLQVYFKGELDYIIAPNKNANNPSSIINLQTGERLR